MEFNPFEAPLTGDDIIEKAAEGFLNRPGFSRYFPRRKTARRLADALILIQSIGARAPMN